MFTSRRSIVLGLAAAAALFPAVQASAQTYPNKSITMVVPFAAGGSTDLVARILAQKLSEQMGVSVVVENRAGAGGNLGAAAVAKASPDGYTVLYGTISTHTLNPLMAKKSAYDPVKDFEPVALVGSIPNVMVVHPSVPAKNVAELIAAAKAEPAKYSYASSGIATPLHLSGEMFNKMAGTQMAHVPYRGAGPAMNDLVGGQVDVLCDQTTNAIPQVTGGKVKAYAVTSNKRIEQLPNLPTVVEAGIPGFEVTVWHGLYAPAGTPAPVVTKLHGALQTALADATIQKRFSDLGTLLFPADQRSPEALGAYLKGEVARWGEAVAKAGVKGE